MAKMVFVSITAVSLLALAIPNAAAEEVIPDGPNDCVSVDHTTATDPGQPTGVYPSIENQTVPEYVQVIVVANQSTPPPNPPTTIWVTASVTYDQMHCIESLIDWVTP